MSPSTLTLCRPVLSFDYSREAYILRGVGDRLGPVLREDRRRGSAKKGPYKGPERRGTGVRMPGADRGADRAPADVMIPAGDAPTEAQATGARAERPTRAGGSSGATGTSGAKRSSAAKSSPGAGARPSRRTKSARG